MALADEIKSFLSEHLSGWLNDVMESDRDRLRTAFQALTDAVQRVEEVIQGLQVPHIDERVQQWTDELVQIAAASATGDRLPELQKHLRDLLMRETQGEILKGLLETARQHADGIGIFVARGENLQGWAGMGLAGTQNDPHKFQQFQIALKSENFLTQAFRSQQPYITRDVPSDKDRILVESMAGYLPTAFAVFPILIKGKCMGLIYADRRADAWTESDLAALEILSWFTSMAIETLPSRLRWIRATRAAAPAEEAAPAAPPEEVTEEEQQQHEEARRFARLLISEIKLYNEQQVVLGRQSGNIYERLKEDIDRSWEVYQERVPESVTRVRNYFYEELVNILADGKPELLGIDHWPPDAKG